MVNKLGNLRFKRKKRTPKHLPLRERTTSKLFIIGTFVFRRVEEFEREGSSSCLEIVGSIRKNRGGGKKKKKKKV